ncbi:MAG: Mrp/NBP35 family ATP-binding protein, partial [Planctomycetes bacterium]|nr:Mrp/NBP35 family ATP-binding protein [Planctomycetota bacterium]
AEGKVRVRIELPTPAWPQPERLADAVRAAIAAASITPPLTKGGGGGGVEVEFSHTVRGKGTGGAVGLRIKNVIAVGSGKGGVGKSTVAATLAFGLQHYGAKVGLMDADVYGPSIPHLVGASGQPAIVPVQGPGGQTIERMQPVEAGGLKLMSIGFMVRPDQAVIWRGPMLHKALQQFLQQTDWGELDYLIIDLPPGTGDVSLTLSQLLGLAGAVVVCTPQQVALLDAVKAISMFNQVKIPVLGIVENMSGEMFGRGGAKAKAQELGVPFLGEIPGEPAIRIRGDEGRIGSLFDADSPARDALLVVTQNVAVGIARNVTEGGGLPTLEIL